MKDQSRYKIVLDERKIRPATAYSAKSGSPRPHALHQPPSAFWCLPANGRTLATHTKKAPEMDAAAVRGRPLDAVIGFRYAAALFHLNTNRLLFGDTRAVWTAVAADENLPDGPPASSFYIK